MHTILVTILLLQIAYIDYKTMKIPDKWNLALGFCGLISCILDTQVMFTDRLIGLFVVSVPMYVLCLIIPDAFGGGDIKLTASMGFYLGWKQVLIGVYLSFLIGGMEAVYLLTVKKFRKEDGTHMAFGPALCLGMWIAMIWGNSLIQWYVEILT